MTTRRSVVRDVRGAKCFAGVMEAAGRPPVAKLELNPSRVGDGDGWALADVAAVEPAVRQALVVMAELVSPPVELARASVRRVDVARDFGAVDSPAEFLRAQSAIRRPYARLNLVHSDPSKNGAQTLMVGSRSGGVIRAYDKHAENALAPDGTVRFEVEARSPWAKTLGDIKRFEDLTRENLLRLAMNRWEWSQMGNEVSGLQVALDKIVRSDLLTNTQKNGLVGFLVTQAAGASQFCSQRQLVRYRSWQRELGVVLEDFDVRRSSSQRLDWDTGQAVTRVA